MSEPITVQGELTIPLSVLAPGAPASDVESWLRYHSLLPPQVQGCRWRLDAERQGYVLAYTVTIDREEGRCP